MINDDDDYSLFCVKSRDMNTTTTTTTTTTTYKKRCTIVYKQDFIRELKYAKVRQTATKLLLNCMFCCQKFADILAAEATEHDIDAELVDLSKSEPEDDFSVMVGIWGRIFEKSYAILGRSQEFRMMYTNLKGDMQRYITKFMKSGFQLLTVI